MLEHLAGCAGWLGLGFGSGSPKPAVLSGTYYDPHRLANCCFLQEWYAK